MERRRAAWLVSLTLMSVGGVLAHLLAYRLLAPTPTASHHRHAPADAESFLVHWRVCLAICGSVALIGLGANALSRVRAGALTAPLWLFALLPPVGFAVQSHLEELLATGALPFAAALEPTFALGLVLQIPFAVAAYLAARALIALAVAVARRLLADPPRSPHRREHVPRPPVRIAVVRTAVCALGQGQRAPPPAVAAS
jgi:hypothetical protein